MENNQRVNINKLEGYKAHPYETGHDACPTIRCNLCNGTGALVNSKYRGVIDHACPRCEGGGIDPTITKEEIRKGVANLS